jgi:hypothetical protein
MFSRSCQLTTTFSQLIAKIRFSEIHNWTKHTLRMVHRSIQRHGLQMSTDENGNEARHGMTYSGIDGSNTGKKTDDDNNKPEQKLLFFCQNNWPWTKKSIVVQQAKDARQQVCA